MAPCGKPYYYKEPKEIRTVRISTLATQIYLKSRYKSRRGLGWIRDSTSEHSPPVLRGCVSFLAASALGDKHEQRLESSVVITATRQVTSPMQPNQSRRSVCRRRVLLVDATVCGRRGVREARFAHVVRSLSVALLVIHPRARLARRARGLGGGEGTVARTHRLPTAVLAR